MKYTSKMKTIRGCLLGLAISSLSIKAETTPWPQPAYERGKNEALTLEASSSLADYLAYAALNNPGLEALFYHWQAAVENVDQVDVLPNPQLTFGYFIEAVETRVGPQDAKVGISQMFPWFGTLALRGDVATEAARMAYEQYQAKKLALFYEVKQAYYEYDYLNRAIQITRENLELLSHFEGVAQSKFRAGGSQTAVIKAQVELGKLEDRLRSLEDLRAPLSYHLSAALNSPLDQLLPWPTQAPLEGASITEENLFEDLRVNNPELKALDAVIAKEDRSVALAHKAYFPSLIVGVDYVFTDEALMANTPDSGKDPVIARVGLDVPIWRGKYRAAEKEATLRHEAAKHTRTQKENMLGRSLRMAMFRFQDAERKIDLYKHSLIPQARQSLNVTEEAYRAGSTDFLNLIDAERLLLEFQLSHERALADREIGLAQIEMLVGRPLTTSSKN